MKYTVPTNRLRPRVHDLIVKPGDEDDLRDQVGYRRREPTTKSVILTWAICAARS